MTDDWGNKMFETMGAEKAAQLGESNSTDLLDTFDEALDIVPHLSIEIGYTRITGWMVHVWDSTGVGLKNAPKIIETQGESKDVVCAEAAAQIKSHFGI